MSIYAQFNAALKSGPLKWVNVSVKENDCFTITGEYEDGAPYYIGCNAFDTVTISRDGGCKEHP